MLRRYHWTTHTYVKSAFIELPNIFFFSFQLQSQFTITVTVFNYNHRFRLQSQFSITIIVLITITAEFFNYNYLLQFACAIRIQRCNLQVQFTGVICRCNLQVQFTSFAQAQSSKHLLLFKHEPANRSKAVSCSASLKKFCQKMFCQKKMF